MTFLTFSTTDIFYSYTIHSVILNIFFILFVHAVKAIIFKLNFCTAVAVQTPTHAQGSKLEHFIIAGNLAMAGLALHSASVYMLSMIEINMIREIVNTHPRNWFCLTCIPGSSGFKTCIFK